MKDICVFTGVVLMLCYVGSCQANDIGNDLLTRHEEVVKQRARELRQFMLSLPEDVFLDLLVETAKKYVPVKAMTEECRNHSNYVLDSFLRGDLWATKMLDASSTLVSGVLDGHIQDLGNYDQCINIQEPDQLFKGQLCVIETSGFLPPELAEKLKRRLNTIFNMDVMFSLCVPSSCSEEDIATHVDRVLAAVNVSSVKNEYSWEKRLTCTSADREPFRIKDYVAMSIFILLAMIVAACTLYESFDGKRPELTAFSLRKNFQILMDTKPRATEISCLNGIRVLFIIFMVMTHRLVYVLFRQPSLRSKTVSDMFYSKIFGTLGLGLYELAPKGSDGFFLIGGTVLSYSFFGSRQKKVPFNLFRSYVTRYFRLTPLLAVLMLYSATLSIYLSDGPLWSKAVVGLVEYPCSQNWWSGLLHISNYATPLYMCIPQSWYVACDFQLFVLSPLFLIPLHKRPKVGLMLLSGCAVVSVVAATIHAYTNKLGTGYLYFVVSMDRRTDMLTPLDYTGAHFRTPCFLMGLALGYLLFMIKQKKVDLRLSKRDFCLGWIVAVLVFVALVITTTIIIQPDHVFNPWIDPLYIGLSRPLFCVSLAWIIFSCTMGYGGFIDHFLSWSGFQPLSRLTYGVYLIHVLVIVQQQFSIQVPLAFNFLDYWFLVSADIILSFIVSSITYVMVEMPCSRLTAYALKEKKKEENSQRMKQISDEKSVNVPSQ